MVTSQTAEQCDSRGSQEGEVSGSSKERCDHIVHPKTIASHDHQHLSQPTPSTCTPLSPHWSPSRFLSVAHLNQISPPCVTIRSPNPNSTPQQQWHLEPVTDPSETPCKMRIRNTHFTGAVYRPNEGTCVRGPARNPAGQLSVLLLLKRKGMAEGRRRAIAPFAWSARSSGSIFYSRLRVSHWVAPLPESDDNNNNSKK